MDASHGKTQQSSQSVTTNLPSVPEHQSGKDKTGCWFRGDAGLSAKLHGTIALPFENGGNGGIVGIDQFIMAQLFALGQPCGLFPDGFMVAHRRGEGKGELLTLGLTQGTRLVEASMALRAKILIGAPRARSCCSVWLTSLTKTCLWPRQLRPKPRMTLVSSCVRPRAWLWSMVVR